MSSRPTPQCNLTGNQQFDLVKAVVTAKMQQISVTGFLPALGITQADLEASTGLISSSMVSVEFSIAYRLGHTMIPDFVGSIDVADLFDGQVLLLFLLPHLCRLPGLQLDRFSL
jgi:hypothetical protein